MSMLKWLMWLQGERQAAKNEAEQMPEAAKARHVGDYLAGMTDTFAISTHNRLFDRTPDLR